VVLRRERTALTKVAGIYVITNTTDDKVYIGSSHDIAFRLGAHKRDLKRNIHRNSHLQRAYNKFGSDYFQYGVLEVVDGESSLSLREQFWIDEYRAYDRRYGYNLIREAEHRMHSEETRARMSAAHKGVPHSPDHRLKIGAAHKGLKMKPRTPEQRAQQSVRQRGRVHSPETRAKLSAVQKGRKPKPASPETRAKISIANKGKPKTEEHRKKIGLAQVGRKLSPDHYQKLVAVQRSRSAETRAKSSVSHGILTPEQVIEIRQKLSLGQSINSLAVEYGISRGAVYDIATDRTWRHLL
jgi:group I intron endonuclease